MSEKVIVTKEKIDSLAEVIGSKSGQSVPLTFEGMEDAVLGIEIGIEPTGTLSINKNGTHDVTKYAKAKVDVQPKLQTVTVKSTTDYQYKFADNGYYGIDEVEVAPIQLETTSVTPAIESQTINPSSNYDGLSQVIIEATPLYETTITPSTEEQIVYGNQRLPYELIGEAKASSLYGSITALKYITIVNKETSNNLFPRDELYYITGEVSVTNKTTNGIRKFIFDGDLNTINSENVLDPNVFDTGDVSGIGLLNIAAMFISSSKKYELKLAVENTWTANFSYEVSLKAYTYKNYIGLSQVTVNPIPPEYGLITWDGNVLTVS